MNRNHQIAFLCRRNKLVTILCPRFLLFYETFVFIVTHTWSSTNEDNEGKNDFFFRVFFTLTHVFLLTTQLRLKSKINIHTVAYRDRTSENSNNRVPFQKACLLIAYTSDTRQFATQLTVWPQRSFDLHVTGSRLRTNTLSLCSYDKRSVST